MSFDLTGKAVKKLRLPVVNYDDAPMPIIQAQENDMNSRYILIELYDDRGTVNLAPYTSVSLNATMPDDTLQRLMDGEIDKNNNSILIRIAGSMLSQLGKVRCDITLEGSDSNSNEISLTSRTFYVLVSPSRSGDDAIIGNDDYNILRKTLNEVEALESAIELNEDSRIAAEEERVAAEIAREEKAAALKDGTGWWAGQWWGTYFTGLSGAKVGDYVVQSNDQMTNSLGKGTVFKITNIVSGVYQATSQGFTIKGDVGKDALQRTESYSSSNPPVADDIVNEPPIIWSRTAEIGDVFTFVWLDSSTNTNYLCTSMIIAPTTSDDVYWKVLYFTEVPNGQDGKSVHCGTWAGTGWNIEIAVLPEGSAKVGDIFIQSNTDTTTTVGSMTYTSLGQGAVYKITGEFGTDGAGHYVNGYPVTAQGWTLKGDPYEYETIVLSGTSGTIETTGSLMDIIIELDNELYKYMGTPNGGDNYIFSCVTTDAEGAIYIKTINIDNMTFPNTWVAASYEVGGNSNPYWGTCDSAADAEVVSVDCDGFVLETGAVINVLFTNAHSNSKLTMNVNSTGTKRVGWRRASGVFAGAWAANEVVQFVYNGGAWEIINTPSSMVPKSVGTNGQVLLSNGEEAPSWGDLPESGGNPNPYWGTCATSYSTSAKVIVCDGFVLETGAVINVKFTYYNGTSSAITLNVNDTGAKTAYWKTTANLYYAWGSGETVQFVYDGTYWRMIGVKTPTTPTVGGASGYVLKGNGTSTAPSWSQILTTSSTTFGYSAFDTVGSAYYYIPYSSSYSLLVCVGTFSACSQTTEIKFPRKYSGIPLVLTSVNPSSDTQTNRVAVYTASTTGFTTRSTGTYYGRYIAIGVASATPLSNT